MLRLDDPRFFAAIDRRVQQRTREGEALSVDEVATMLWGFASVNIAPSPEFWKTSTEVILDAIAAQCDAPVSFKSLARVGWSAAVTQHYDPKLLSAVCRSARHCLVTTYCNEFQISQLRFVRERRRMGWGR